MADWDPGTTEGSFLGRGWSFPPSFDRRMGGVAMLQDELDIASSLAILLSTARGERVMLPEFGCNLDELVFAMLDTRTRTLIVDKIRTAILYHEPRIELERVQLEPAKGLNGLDGEVLVDIVYRIKATNSRFNFVYPYAGREGTDTDPAARQRPLPDQPPVRP